MKKIIIILVIVLLVVPSTLLTGCWDLVELEDLSIIAGIGIDHGPGEDEVTMTIENVLPSVAGGGGMAGGGGTSGKLAPRIVLQASGSTMSEVRDRLEEISVRRTFFAFTGVLIVGEEAARKDMDKILEFFDRNPRLRRSAFVVVTPGKASDAMAVSHPYEPSSSQVIRGLLISSGQTSVTFPIRIGDVFEDLAIAGIEPVAPGLDVSVAAQGATDQSGHGHGDEKTLSEPHEIELKTGEHRLAGMAVFKGDKLVGWLNKEESRGWGWIRGRVQQGHSDILKPRSAKGKVMPVTFRLAGGKSSIKFTFEDDQVVAHLTIKARGEVLEWVNGRDLIDPGIISSLEDDLAGKIKTQVEAAIRKTQEDLQSDILGMGFSLFRQHRREWKELYRDRWPEIFPTVPVEVEVEAQVLNTGTVVRALKIKP